MVEKEKNKETLKAEEEKKRKYRNRIINKKDNKMEKNKCKYISNHNK